MLLGEKGVKCKLSLFLLLFSVVFLCSQVKTNELIVYYFHRPPLYIHTETDSPSGFICEIVDLVLKKSGLNYRWQEVPAARVEQLFRENNYALAVGWYYKREREEWAQYSRPIYTDGPMVAIVNRINVPIKEPVTIKFMLSSPYKLGVINGFSYGTVLDAAIEQYKPKKEIITGTQESLLAMVSTSRLDYMLLSLEEAVYMRRMSSTALEKTSIVVLKDAPLGLERYILASYAVPRFVIDVINKSISKIRSSPEYKKIIDKYFKN